ncbi:ADP-ribosyl-(dinitrogen reductase) hydrolase [Undibacterium sp. Dicai25W]|uniref:ADP-ribosyl-(dinitrogen reductase) hydrolase n=1 Tax=Undibacterium sp. Dicai25W TaxID=3413034 RepID=UPI003BF1068E
MLPIRISQAIKDKLHEKHRVCPAEVEQCFENKCGLYLIDDREDHRTDPESLWFIAETNRNRLLKIVFMFIDGNVHIKTAYEPNIEEIAIYQEEGQ